MENDFVTRLLGELGQLECSTTELAEVLAALVEHSPVPLWIYDDNQFIVYNNRASCDFGTGNNVVGSHVDAFSPQIREMLKQGLEACQATGKVCSREGWISSHIIGERYLRFDFMPLPSGLTACLSHDSTENKRVEEALKASEDRATFLADMLERALVPFAAAYPDGRLMIANIAFCELTGYSETELRGINLFRELTAAESQDQERWALDLLHSTGRPQRYEKLVVRKDGTTVPVEMFVQQVIDDNGNLRRISAFVTDISERKRAGEALRESEERFRLVTELASDGIWDWRIGEEEEYLSPRFKQMLGYEDRELANHANTWERLIHQDDMPIAKQAFQDHHERGSPFMFTARYFHKDGSIVWVTCRGKAIKDNKGQFYRIVGTHTDITESKLAEESLAEAHEFNQRIISASTVGIVVSKAAGPCVLVNDAAARVIGASREEILKQNFRQLKSWRNSGLLAAADVALSSGTTQSGEFHLLTTFGMDVWWDCKLTPFTSKGELHLLTVFNDITERKRAEAALQQSEEFLQAVVSNSPLGVSVRDRTGKLLSYNAAWQRIWQVSDEFIAADMRKERQELEFEANDEYCKPWWAEIKRIFDEGGTLLITEARTGLEGPGAAVWVSQHFYGILDKHGKVDRVVVITQDITERKRAEMALRESEERLALALEGAADGIWDHNPVSGITYRSPHMAIQLGYGPEGLAPTPEAWLEIVHPDDRQRVLAAWQAHIEGRTEQYATEHRLRCTNGEYLWVLDSGKVVQRDAEGRPLRVAGTHKVITERKLMEERLLREQREETLVALAGGIAHDFNNILMGILGAASLLSESLAAQEPALELCELISTSAHRMADLTSKLLAYARGGVFHSQPIDVKAAVHEALSMTRATIPPQISIQARLPDGLWAVQADASQLGQVLLNLLINAREAIGEDSGQIIISAENAALPGSWHDASGEEHPAGNYVLVRVSDSGCGMNEVTQRRIFEPFFSTKCQGRGLGLAAVAGILQMHGGAISVESQPGQGCTFTVLLPATAKAEQHERSAGFTPPVGTEVVLVVDDNEIVLFTTRAMLQHLGYIVLAASSSIEALELFRDQAQVIELAILDSHMPQLSGPNLLALLRQTKPRLPAIISSGFSADEAFGETDQNELTAFIQKPYRLADMAGMVRRLIDAVAQSNRVLNHHWADMPQRPLRPAGDHLPWQA